MKKLSLQVYVYTPSPLALIFVVGVFSCREVEMAIISCWLVRLDACSTYLAYKQSADGKGVVADGFGGQPSDILKARCIFFEAVAWR